MLLTTATSRFIADPSPGERGNKDDKQIYDLARMRAGFLQHPVIVFSTRPEYFRAC